MIAGRLLVESVGQTIAVRDIDRIDVAVVVIEDLCWRIAMAGWSERKPPIWRRRARVTWRADGQALQAKRDRIRLMAAEFGLCVEQA